MFKYSAINITLTILILIFFVLSGYVYKLRIEIELLKEDVYKLKYPSGN